ncbi:hypothetical protein [Marinobacter sp.]|uniref:hypothetical protein n=1 Tax=Pseudomonadota TaxID=1224 RepID=UPI003265DE64
MPNIGTDVRLLHAYVRNAMRRADHHAEKVQGIALALIGGIIWRGKLDTLEIKQFNGSLANMLWVEIGQRRYAFAYNPETEEIEIIDRTRPDRAPYRISSETSPDEVVTLFRSLGLEQK